MMIVRLWMSTTIVPYRNLKKFSFPLIQLRYNRKGPGIKRTYEARRRNSSISSWESNIIAMEFKRSDLEMGIYLCLGTWIPEIALSPLRVPPSSITPPGSGLSGFASSTGDVNCNFSTETLGRRTEQGGVSRLETRREEGKEWVGEERAQTLERICQVIISALRPEPAGDICSSPLLETLACFQCAADKVRKRLDMNHWCPGSSYLVRTYNYQILLERF